MQTARLTRIRATLAIAMLAAMISVGTPASAAIGPDTCIGAGAAHVFPVGDGSYFWAVDGVGSCQTGDVSIMSATGGGISDGLGLCDGGILAPISLFMIVTFVDPVTNMPRVEVQSWSAPAVVFPHATPLVIGGAGGEIGAAVIGSRFYGACPGDANENPKAQIVFSFLP